MTLTRVGEAIVRGRRRAQGILDALGEVTSSPLAHRVVGTAQIAANLQVGRRVRLRGL